MPPWATPTRQGDTFAISLADKHIPPECLNQKLFSVTSGSTRGETRAVSNARVFAGGQPTYRPRAGVFLVRRGGVGDGVVVSTGGAVKLNDGPEGPGAPAPVCDNRVRLIPGSPLAGRLPFVGVSPSLLATSWPLRPFHKPPSPRGFH